jgi:predicted outer membrane repeat protein
MGAYEYQPPPLYVDANSTGANNGKSWADAYKYLQNALAASLSGDSIWVAQGAYRPDANTAHPAGTNDRTATFQLKNGVAIYGGFPTGGGLWEGRKPNAYPTILSGDINVPYDNNDNSYHVITGSGTNSTAVLDGFTITKGYANGASGYRYGGGMYNNTSSPTVTNCTFRSNSALHYGGGVYNEYSSPTVINCIFTTNNTLYGGGMYNVNSDPNIVNCIFTGNLADYYGGGLFNSFSYPTLANCILWGNTAPTGPQMYNEVSTPNVSFSDVQGGWTGTGNINANPLFVDPNGPDNIPGNEDDNLRLSPGSPCIDDGNNSAVPVGIEIDPDGRDRFADGDCNTTIVVDMGAYEFTSAYLGDFDSDVDFLDYAIQANFWLTDEFLMDIAPTPAGDGIIDTSDLAVLCDNWLEIF